MGVIDKSTSRAEELRTSTDGYESDTSSSAMLDSQSVEDEIEEFGAKFVSAMRRKTAERPESLRISDIVDVFSSTGEFLYRGVVEQRSESNAQVRVDQSTGGNNAEPVTYKVNIEISQVRDC